jgi:hypothetical protein
MFTSSHDIYTSVNIPGWEWLRRHHRHDTWTLGIRRLCSRLHMTSTCLWTSQGGSDYGVITDVIHILTVWGEIEWFLDMNRCWNLFIVWSVFILFLSILDLTREAGQSVEFWLSQIGGCTCVSVLVYMYVRSIVCMCAWVERESSEVLVVWEPTNLGWASSDVIWWCKQISLRQHFRVDDVADVEPLHSIVVKCQEADFIPVSDTTAGYITMSMCKEVFFQENSKFLSSIIPMPILRKSLCGGIPDGHNVFRNSTG